MSEARTVPLARLLRPAAPAPSPDEIRAEAEAQAHADADREWSARLADAEARHAADAAQAAGALASRSALTDNLLAALEERFAESLATLAHALARQVLGADPRLRPETLRALVADALAALPEGAAGTLHLSPQDVSALAPPPGWQLRPDPALSPGTVRAEAGPALARAGLALRLDALQAGPDRS